MKKLTCFLLVLAILLPMASFAYADNTQDVAEADKSQFEKGLSYKERI